MLVENKKLNESLDDILKRILTPERYQNYIKSKTPAQIFYLKDYK